MNGSERAQGALDLAKHGERYIKYPAPCSLLKLRTPTYTEVFQTIVYELRWKV